MVYITKATVKGKEYWVLAHSYRAKGKIRKKLKYIGKDLPDAKVLEKLKKEFEKEVGEKRSLDKKTVMEIIKKNQWKTENAPAVLHHCMGFTYG